jgi:hypothetical protein
MNFSYGYWLHMAVPVKSTWKRRKALEPECVLFHFSDRDVQEQHLMPRPRLIC